MGVPSATRILADKVAPDPPLPGVFSVSSTDPEPFSNDRAGGEALKGLTGTQPLSGTISPVAETGRRLWGWALAAGVVAGILTWVGGEVAWGGGNSARSPRIIAFPSAADHARVVRGLVRSNSVSFIQEGAILGCILGLAGGLTRRSARAGLLAALVGVGFGAAVAAAAAHLLLSHYFESLDPGSDSLMTPMLTHGGIWGAVGAAAGLAFGLGAGGRRRWARCVLGGLLGGVAATIVYDIVGAMAFPLDKTSQPISATVVTRLLAQLSVAVFVAVGVALVASVERKDLPPAP